MSILSALNLFPIKSLTGISVYSWPLEKSGLQHDRKWMIVDSDGKFITRREHPEMALIGTEIGENTIVVYDRKNPKDNTRIPLQMEGEERMLVEVWNFMGNAIPANEEANQWITKKLGVNCSFVFMPESMKRMVNSNYSKPGDFTNFSDGYPVLLINSRSLEDLNSRMERPLEMERFRPNMVVQGFSAWEEDGWKNIRIGGIDFRVVKPCDRCVITTIDPETAEKGKEPLKTLATFRTVNNQVLFGQNLVPDGEGLLKVGDEVKILPL